MGALLQTLRNLGPLRLAVMGGVLLGLAAFFIYLTTRLGQPDYALLFSELEANDANRIVEKLEAQNVPYQLQSNGTRIMVPSDQVMKLRLAMAEQGLPNGGSVGYEIFDNADSLGATNFVQNINLVRALEGELSRTIAAIDIVHSARVHLVLPRRELFSRERQEPSASVILKMRNAQRLGREQVVAIQHMVASAIPELNPQRVSMIDDKGNLLAKGFDGGFGDAGTPEERLLAFENRTARTVEELLEKTVGFGRVRAEVSVDMDFDKVTTTSENYDPEGQVVRSTNSIEETMSNRDGPADSVSVGNNLPDSNLGSSDGTTSSTAAETRTEEVVNYEISKKVTSHTREAGVVKRLSVAVLVDGRYNEGAKGEMLYEPRTEQEMEQLATLVRTAIGFDADRGDSVEVLNMRFAGIEAPPEPPLELFFGLGKNDLLRMAEIVVLSIVAILVILLVVRPLVTRAFEALPGTVHDAERLLAEAGGGAPQLTGPGMGAPSIGMDQPVPDDGDEFDELIDIDRVEGRVKASSVKKVGEIVDKHPEEALSIVRNWMYQQES